MFRASKFAPPAALALLLSFTATAQKPPLPGDACKLLADAEVRRVFAGAKDGVRETRAESYGIAGCSWKLPVGTFEMNYVGDIDDIDGEMRSLVESYVDPMRPQSARNVRVIRVSAVGDAALGFAEPRSEAKGILIGVALLIVQRGGKQIALFSTHSFAEGEREAALKALQELARAAVRRM